MVIRFLSLQRNSQDNKIVQIILRNLSTPISYYATKSDSTFTKGRGRQVQKVISSVWRRKLDQRVVVINVLTSKNKSLKVAICN